MRIDRHGAAVRLELGLDEADVLEQLLDGLDELLQPDAGTVIDVTAGADADADADVSADGERGATTGPGRGAVLDRLFPAGYLDDDDAARTFRDMTVEGLRTDRAERAERCAAELATGRGRRQVHLQLDADAVSRWLRVLNDLRLVLGTELGVGEDDDWELDPSDPQLLSRARYVWLTAVQDALVDTVLPD